MSQVLVRRTNGTYIPAAQAKNILAAMSIAEQFAAKLKGEGCREQMNPSPRCKRRRQRKSYLEGSFPAIVFRREPVIGFKIGEPHDILITR